MALEGGLRREAPTAQVADVAVLAGVQALVPPETRAIREAAIAHRATEGFLSRVLTPMR